MPPQLKHNRWAVKKGLFKKEGGPGMLLFHMVLLSRSATQVFTCSLKSIYSFDLQPYFEALCEIFLARA